MGSHHPGFLDLDGDVFHKNLSGGKLWKLIVGPESRWVSVVVKNEDKK